MKEVRDAWKTSRGRVAAGEADGLRLRLWINAPDLAALPWELLFEEQYGFLAAAANLGISRYLPVPEPPLLSTQKPLRILVVVESLEKLPIDPKEVDQLRDALGNLGNRVEYKILENVPAAEIQKNLQEDYHVFHFLGHGRAGELALTKPDGKEPEYMSAEEFSQLFSGRTSLRLVVLNACHSSHPDELTKGGLFAGVGPALVQKQMPAVVAMQYHTVQLDTAGKFSRAFYDALAKGRPVDFAVNEARQQLSASKLLHDRDWSTPVLYMSTRSGRILFFPQEDGDLVNEVAQEAAQASALAAAVLAELSQRFNEVTFRSNRLREWLKFESSIQDLRISIDQLNDIIKQAVPLRQKEFVNKFESLQFPWEHFRYDVSKLMTFGEYLEYINKPISMGSKVASESGVEAWLEELNELGKELDKLLENPLPDAEDELYKLKVELRRLGQALRDSLRDRWRKSQEHLNRESEELNTLTKNIHSQLKL